MSNDIQKYRYLIESIVLDESFKDAERIFTDVNGNQKEVSGYIELFKELSKRNKIQGMEKDISRWIKSGWDDFKKFVDSKKEVQSKREVRAIQKKDSIHVYHDEEKIVVVPLTKEASIHYGKNTSWCTSYTKSPNQFPDYFYIKGITLFYVLFKNGDKYACAYRPDQPNTIECFDQQDVSISFNEFSDATGIRKNDIHGWYSSNKGVILKAQDINNIDEEAQIELVKEDSSVIEHITNPSEELQLAAMQRDGFAIGYIDNPSEAVQLAAVQNDGDAIKDIDNPSEAVQLAAVQNQGGAIEYIIDKGIETSEEVQLAAIQNDASIIRYIDNPSETIQIAAVQIDSDAINDLYDPSEAVQLAAVQNDATSIFYIDNPSETLQIAAVQNYTGIIRDLYEPSEAVQLAAVQNDASIIRYIANPSEAVQLAAVQKDNIIQYIIDKGITPSEKVLALHNKLYK